MKPLLLSPHNIPCAVSALQWLQELFDAIVVNPYDEDAVADAIAVALSRDLPSTASCLRWAWS